MCAWVCTHLHFFFPPSLDSLPSTVLQPQHILPSAVHHSDSRDSSRGCGWKRSSRLPSVMDRNSLESLNGRNLTLTPSSHGLCDLSTCNPLTSGAWDSAAHKKEWVKKTVRNCIFHNEETGSERPLYMQEVTQVSIRNWFVTYSVSLLCMKTSYSYVSDWEKSLPWFWETKFCYLETEYWGMYRHNPRYWHLLTIYTVDAQVDLQPVGPGSAHVGHTGSG